MALVAKPDEITDGGAMGVLSRVEKGLRNRRQLDYAVSEFLNRPHGRSFVRPLVFWLFVILVFYSGLAGLR